MEAQSDETGDLNDWIDVLIVGVGFVKMDFANELRAMHSLSKNRLL